MKKVPLLALLAAGSILNLQAQIGVTGYANHNFSAGNNWFGNPLWLGDNTLNSIFFSAPEGTTVSLWDSQANAYTAPSLFASGQWSINYTLRPGTGALLHAPTNFLYTFVGIVYDFQGRRWLGDRLTPPPPAGPDGLYLFSARAPVQLASPDYPAFLYLAGRAPREGEQFTLLNASNQVYFTTTFIGGAWDNGDPMLSVTDAALLNLGPVTVPEPGVAGIALVALGAGVVFRRRS